MKKILLSVTLICFSISSFSQDSLAKNSTIHRLRTNDEMLPNLCLDVNFKFGWLGMNMTLKNIEESYRSKDKNTAKLGNNRLSNSFDAKGISAVSGDFQIGYFLGDKHLIGIGTGLMYQQMSGIMSLGSNATGDLFSVEYENFDGTIDPVKSAPFKQIITANNVISERVTVTNISVPLMIKFKHQFKKQWGVFAEAGGLFSLSSTSTTEVQGKPSFNYEAIYDKRPNGTPDGGEWYYNTGVISDKAILLTQDYVNSLPLVGTVNTYFDNLNAAGYNVALEREVNVEKANNTKTTTSFGAGILLQGGISYQFSYRITGNLGGYYLTQTLKNKSTDNWRITDKVGDYSSMLNGVKNNTISSYGFTVGIRYFIGKDRDEDGDGLPDKKDLCPKEYGLAMLGGCADTDSDGIPDQDDHCPTEYGVICTGGCPDSDEDCVPDKFDKCPDEPVDDIDRSMITLGCPDKDGDGIKDTEDACPEIAGLVMYGGCPNRSSFAYDTVMPDPKKMIPDHIVLSKSVINFKTGKSNIADSTYPALDEVVRRLLDDERIIVYISGHTDNVGGNQKNMMLSFYRAAEVKKYIMTKGISSERILISGMGKKEPVIPEDTPENKAKNNTPDIRSKNRRIEMRMLIPVSAKR